MSNSQTRILLIEDNKIQARATQNCLGKIHDIVLETTVKEAHTRLKNAEFDLVIVDWALPGQSGISFVRALREDPDLRDLPVMMQTGEDRSKYVQQAVEAGVDDYVVKPAYCETLREKVEALLESSSADPQAE